MKKTTAVLSAILGLSLSGLLAQEIDNPDFSHGKAGWQGDGKAVFFDSAGAVSETASPGSVPGLMIELNRNAWREIRQTVRPKQKESEIRFSVQVMADPAFKRLAESKKFSDVDFGEGGGYVWSALVFPKCDFLIRVHDDGWFYRPFSLMPAGTWKAFSADFPKLKTRQREIALLFPPGEGTVYLKGK
jgi:hypothetical protein